MTTIHWKIHWVESVKGGKPVLGRIVAEVRADEGKGSLVVFAKEHEETLRELFEEELLVFTSSEEIGESGVGDAGQILQPWQPETLEHLKSQIRFHRFWPVPAD